MGIEAQEEAVQSSGVLEDARDKRTMRDGDQGMT